MARRKAGRIGRQPYGRALVLPIDECPPSGIAGLLDIKGAGVAPGLEPAHALPQQWSRIRRAPPLADFFYGWLVDRILERTVPGYCTVPVYAVIDLGFDIVNGHHGTGRRDCMSEGLMQERKAAVKSGLPAETREKVILQIEFILRSHGITTARTGTSFSVAQEDDVEILRYGKQPVVCKNQREEERASEIIELIRGSRLEIINIQLAQGADWHRRTAQFVDLGHVNVRRRFSYPIASQARDGLLGIGRILMPGDVRFVAPDPHVAVDPELCDRHVVNACGLYAAQAFRSPTSAFGSRDIEIFLRLGIARALRQAWR